MKVEIKVNTPIFLMSPDGLGRGWVVVHFSPGLKWQSVHHVDTWEEAKRWQVRMRKSHRFFEEVDAIVRDQRLRGGAAKKVRDAANAKFHKWLRRFEGKNHAVSA